METNQPWSREFFVLLDDVVRSSKICVSMTKYIIFLVTRVVFKTQPSYFVSKKISGNLTVVTTEVGFKLSQYYGIWR
jgi:hypothetical protein